MSKQSNEGSRSEPLDPAAPSPELEFDLSLEDTTAQKNRGLGKGRIAPVVGYNPYDARPGKTPAPARIPGTVAPTETGDSKRKPTDLRKLSEWIRLQRQVAALKNEKPDPE